VRVIAVAVPVPGLGALTYAVPDGFPDPPIGARILVPLGSRTLTGIAIAQGSGPGLTPLGFS
jgi:primosomal protein N'